ncbi:MAG: hypothetical protein ACOCQR_02775 [bacterium]
MIKLNLQCDEELNYQYDEELDYSFIYQQQCTSTFGSHKVDGYSVYISHDWRTVCDCSEFKYKKTNNRKGYCKHITRVLEKGCEWHSAFSEEKQSEKQKKNHICPVCGNKTVTIRMKI